jgi:hypothetical protein
MSPNIQRHRADRHFHAKAGAELANALKSAEGLRTKEGDKVLREGLLRCRPPVCVLDRDRLAARQERSGWDDPAGRVSKGYFCPISRSFLPVAVSYISTMKRFPFCSLKFFQFDETEGDAGGESGILFQPLPASHSETCTCHILPCVCAGYKQWRSSGTVSIVSLIRCNSRQSGITGISRKEQGSGEPMGRIGGNRTVVATRL